MNLFRSTIAPLHCKWKVRSIIKIDLVHQADLGDPLVDLSGLPGFSTKKQCCGFNRGLEVSLKQPPRTGSSGGSLGGKKLISMVDDDDLVILEQSIAAEFIKNIRRLNAVTVELETLHYPVCFFNRCNEAAGVFLHEERILATQDDDTHRGVESRRCIWASTGHPAMVSSPRAPVRAEPRTIPGMLMLQVIEGPDRGRVFPLPVDEPQLIGRSTEALPSTDTSISRRHAELTPDGDSWYVRDLDSSNGTFVNDERIDGRTVIKPGDALQCGSSKYRFIDASRDIGGPVGSLEQERLASVGQTVASISHAIKNILQGLRGGASAIELAIDRGDLELAREGWPILSRNLDRIYDLTFNMLAYSRARGLEPERQLLGPVLEEAVELVRPLAVRRRVTIELVIEEDMPPVPYDSNALHQAILNLLLNAVEAAPSKEGTVLLAAGWNVEEEEAWIVVEDNGPGIDPSRHEDVFRPFASTKGQRGTGLGLPVTRQLVEDHSGRVELEASDPGGARFRIILPGSGPEDPGETTGPRPTHPPHDYESEFDL